MFRHMFVRRRHHLRMLQLVQYRSKYMPHHQLRRDPFLAEMRRPKRLRPLRQRHHLPTHHNSMLWEPLLQHPRPDNLVAWGPGILLQNRNSTVGWIYHYLEKSLQHLRLIHLRFRYLSIVVQPIER